jgi:hypothetical protein
MFLFLFGLCFAAAPSRVKNNRAVVDELSLDENIQIRTCRGSGAVYLQQMPTLAQAKKFSVVRTILIPMYSCWSIIKKPRTETIQSWAAFSDIRVRLI